MKYKILIADDEIRIIHLIEQLGHWEELGIEIVGITKDGEETLDSIEKLKPDIVLTDIKMPVMDGIQLIEEAKKKGFDTNFIVISGYKHFEYARSAISLGVVDYLLKPLDEQQLNETLRKTCNKIDASRQLKDNQSRLNEYIRIDRREAHCRFWEILFQEPSNVDKMPTGVEECNHAFMTEFIQGVFQCACISTNVSNLLTEEASIFSEKVYEGLKNCFGGKCVYLQFMRSNDLLLILNFPEQDKEFVKKAFHALLYHIENLSEIYGTFYINIGLSSVKEEIEDLPVGLHEAITADWGAFVYHVKSIIEYDIVGHLPHFKLWDVLPTTLDLQIQDAIRVFDFEKIGELFGEVAANAAEYQNANPDDMRKTMEYMMNNFLWHHAQEENLEEVRQMCIAACRNAKNFRQMIRNFYQFLEEILRKRSMIIESKRGKPVEEVIKYIAENYAEPLSLEQMSEKVKLSSTYFSKLFKAEMGIGFAEYLSNFRLERAKELLVESNDSVKEIAYKVGYQDDKYFLRLFKKQLGISPKEYRKLYV